MNIYSITSNIILYCIQPDERTKLEKKFNEGDNGKSTKRFEWIYSTISNSIHNYLLLLLFIAQNEILKNTLGTLEDVIKSLR